MTPTLKPSNAEWIIITVKEPVLWSRSPEETWMLNPRVRYIVNASQLESLSEKVSTVTDLKNSRYYTPLQASRSLGNSTILVERHRDRGYGDYLFLTGPLNYLKHISGSSAQIDMYALADKGKIMENHPTLSHTVPFAGPILYDTLHLYNYHWFIDSVTEYDEEKDQLNVYDALYKQLGVEPGSVHPNFKRPSMMLTAQDYKDLDTLYYYIFLNKKIDLRRNGYYVVAPSTNASLRSAAYSTWLHAIQHLSKIRTVVVIGQNTSSRVPATDMTYGSFVSQLDSLGPNVINLVGGTPIRVVSALISIANCCFSLDSGPLYIAQALRVPCVSLWGPISPHTRIGYDKDYLDLAIWNRDACTHCSCFAYHSFPVDKCPRGTSQIVCEPLLRVSTDQILDKVKIVEEKYRKGSEMPK
jgi:Glycosyltransferase family 9 (heptosyltransferase)